MKPTTTKGGGDMGMTKKIIKIVLWVILCAGIVVFLFSSSPSIGKCTWVLSYAQKTEAPFSVVVHGKDFAASNSEDPMFKFSKPIELICEAKAGKLMLTDITNGQTYEGIYKITSVGGGRFHTFKGPTYSVIINGVEGTANISSDFNRTLFISIGGYVLNFDAE